MIVYSNPEGVHAPLGSYSHTAKVPAGTELVFLSGQVGVRPDGFTPSTLPEQADQAFANIISLLAAHGLKATDIVKLTTYIVSGFDGQAIREVRQKYLGSHHSVSTLLYVSGLSNPAWMIELEALAAKGEPEGEGTTRSKLMN
jgi:2-iminobutanoate/2-iminopropanoate deaminase